MYPDTEEAKSLIAELCRLFYDQGWVSGTGGGISVRTAQQRIAMAPSGVQKERMRPEDMFVLDLKGKIITTPASRPPPYKPAKLSECSPLFMLAYELRDAGAVMHSHSMNAVLATLLDPSSPHFSCTHLEMIKGIAGHGFYDSMVVPVIENTARECELTDRMRAAMIAHPNANAVLVRRHGVYVWGKTWIEAKTQAECFDYLFGIAVKMAGMGIDAARPPPPLPLVGAENGRSNGANGDAEANGHTSEPPAKRARAGVAKRLRTPTHVVLDIEGTVAPIQFVAETLFPYARKHVGAFLEASFEAPDVQVALAKLMEDAEGTSFAQLCKQSRTDAIAAAVAAVEAQMAADRKTTGLKALQGLIWHEAYESGAIKGELFRDVPDALQEYRNAGIKTFIYSSGSRKAQADLFGHTTVGDLRPYVMGHFDTTSGGKKEAASYEEIRLALGARTATDICFATDILEEAQAASQAGWVPILFKRPGNAALPKDPGFAVVESMDELLSAYAAAL